MPACFASWGLIALFLTTSYAMATVCAWLVPLYWAVIALIVFAPNDRAHRQSSAPRPHPVHASCTPDKSSHESVQARTVEQPNFAPTCSEAAVREENSPRTLRAATPRTTRTRLRGR